MKDLIKHILETPFFRNILKLSISSVVTMVLSIVVTPILSRIYSPEAYGEWGVFSSVVMILSSIIFLSYENAIVRTKDRQELPGITCLCLLIAGIIIILTVIVFLLGSLFQIKFFVNYPSVILLVIVLIITALDALFGYISNRYSKYNTMSIAGVTMGVSQAVSRLAFGIIPLARGLIYGNILALFLKAVYYLKDISQILKNDIIRRVSYKEVKNLAVKYRRFPMYDAPARLIEYVIGNIVIIILSAFFDLKEIGCFSMISMLVQMPLSLMGTSMSTVYFKDLSEVSNDSLKLTNITNRTVRVCFLMSILPSIFLVLGGDYLLVLFLGDKWTLAGSMSLCLAIFSIPVILTEPLLPIFKVLDKQNLRFWLNVANLVAAIGSLLLGAYLIKNILFVLVLYSTFYAILRFVMFGYQLKLASIPLTKYTKYYIAYAFIYFGIAIRLYFVI